MKLTQVSFLLSVATCLSLNVKAAAIPYAAAGTIPATHTFTVAQTGEVNAYFYGSTATDDEDFGVSVNGMWTGIAGLQNHTARRGQELSFGTFTGGSALTFEIYVENSKMTFYSDPSLNQDGINHLYATAFAGNAVIPQGTFLGFEDVLLGDGSDLNYNDEDVILTNIRTVSATPEPGSIMLLGVGLAGVCLCWFRRKQLAMATSRSI